MNIRYVIGVVIVVLIMFFAITRIVGRDDKRSDDRTVNLAQYAERDGRVEYTTYGKVNGEQERRAIRISVSRGERVVEVLSGYEERVESRQRFDNIEAAYAEFIMALHRAGYARQRAADNDQRGYCPLGNRYEYKLFDSATGDSGRVFDYWSTSCNSGQGSFAGQARLVRQLFQQQIPDYNSIVRDIRL